MPALISDGALSMNTSTPDSSFDKPSRKSLSGVFQLSNGAATEPQFQDQRQENLKNFKSTSLYSMPQGAQTGSTTTGRDRAQSKSGSTTSFTNGFGRASYESASEAAKHISKSPPRAQMNGSITSEDRQPDTNGTRTSAETATAIQHDKPGSISEAAPRRSSASRSQFDSAHSNMNSLNRFSSPPGMSSRLSDANATSSRSLEQPRLAHRHTLQVPKSSTSRGSRDFSFSGGPSEEGISTGRFSPAVADGPRHRRASLGLTRRRTGASEAHNVDEVLPDEDVMRWTEAIRQKRASKRQKKEEEDDDRVVVGTKVDQGHVNWVTAYNMLTGIRFTVSRTNAKIDRQLTDVDFQARHKFSFDITGNELTPSAKYDFKFKDYAPWVFRHLRTIFRLDPADYLMSLTSKYILSELGSPGKSGSFFYFSRDYKYIIKTIHHAEHKLLRRVLKDYYNHVVQNPNTLVSQFYGLHRVKIPYGRKIHFIVMNNLFPPHRDIHQMFDLKGSTIGRDFKEEDLEKNPRATMKDLNWLRRDLHLEFGPPKREIFLEQVRRDVALLQKLKIMDYSLLVGIHDLSKGNDENVRETTLRVFQPGGERDEEGGNVLTRTPSRLENAKKARELRLTLKKERPVPMGMVNLKMPEELLDERKYRMFYSDDGGIRADHEDGRSGDAIYYLGIIDCLTNVSWNSPTLDFY